MEHISHCPICNSTDLSDLLTAQDYTVSKESFSLVLCKKCDLAITSPRPEISNLGSYYKSEEYVSHSDTSKGILNKLYKAARYFTLRSKYSKVKPYLNRGFLLDIGCGTGAFLNFCAEKGHQVIGIEPDLDARTMAAKEKGLSVFGEDKLNELNGQSADVITMWHVLEHVPDLPMRLKQMKHILADDGRIFIAVPNKNSYDAQVYGKFWAAYDVPRHLWHFTPTAIQKLSEQHGFFVEDILAMPLDAYYISMLSEKYKGNKWGIIQGAIKGGISNLKAGKLRYSSQIYVLRHA
ncbi:MAG: class I SAM-dependent methyltransferase [Bacteroidia bacterium]|jgi:2-polyprenyl-3-methyl-5-hydroxy-6-metoxy-1,4-benzoquinol methylase